MIDLEAALRERMEMARGDRATPETAEGDVIEAYHTGRIAGLRTALELVERREQQADAAAAARTDGGIHEDDPGVPADDGQDIGDVTAYGEVLKRQADAAERQADALESIRDEQRFQSAAIADVAWRLQTLELWVRRDRPEIQDHGQSHRAFINGLADHNFKRVERDSSLAGYDDLLPDGHREERG